VDSIINVDVDQFYGIEYDEFAVRIAEVAMWLIDHQMNMKVSHAFGQYFVRLPLRKAAKILHTNALRIDWKTIVAPNDLNFILGNPPFVGKQQQNLEQKADMERVMAGIQGAGVLDYVTAWYIKAAQFTEKTEIRTAFVSTNSIAQGEQVGILWGELFGKYKLKIQFAHRTFAWSNEAKGNAAVHCVIIGFGTQSIENKRIFDYENVKSEPIERKVKNINSYLAEGNDLTVLKRTKPLCNVPAISRGNMANDDGNFIFFNESEKDDFLKTEPNAAPLIKSYMGSEDFINNKARYCLWLKDVKPTDIKNLKNVLDRVERVKKYRLSSSRLTTQKLAAFPTLFAEIRQPNTDFLIIPSVSSEKRNYIPIGYISKNVIINTDVSFIPNASLYYFGVLTAMMHMTWVKYVCGRMKSDFRYSNTIVYNNYPFPQNASEAQKQKVTDCAHKVLEIRKLYPESSLADLYDALTMPPDLVKAHQALDKAVDQCYRPQAFLNELSRIEYLFGLYEQLNAPMFQVEKKKRK
jgi:hypothetical protein